ncbi:MAG: alpha-amylase family glycosyl hydrolase [Promethearchaeota archaeon]
MRGKNPKNIPWWKKTTVYQVYPRSFKDSTGNGVGDIPGIISKLDYLQDLGIETIWFSPFFTSPQADHGYDVSDYRDIAPEYGTMADCNMLIQEIHNRAMHVVFDMVLNHTSDQHPWFLESRSSRENPKRDWYIWRDGKMPDGKKPPNNWKSMVGGSGWHYDELTEQWYWAQFLPFQPDLNYRNPDIKREMNDTMRFWLDKGVDGFRLDIINTIYEDEQLRDNPFAFSLFPSDEDARGMFQNNIHTINHPENYAFVKELRRIMDEYSNPERFLVGEITSSLEVLKRYSGEIVDAKTDGLHLTFQFQSLNVKPYAEALRHLIEEYERFLPEPYMPTWVFSNHDQARRISKLGNDFALAKLNVMIQLTVRGVPFIYYGEEIGMPSYKIPLKRGQDPIAKKFSGIPQILVNLLTRSGRITLNRDECRTPMQWNASPNAGFCPDDSDPWLSIAPGFEEINVEIEESDSDSLLHFYRDLLHLRRNTPALHSGSLNLIELRTNRRNVLAFEREFDKQSVQVWLNMSKKSISVEKPHTQPKVLFSVLRDSNPIEDDIIRLEPLQGIILEL